MTAGAVAAIVVSCIWPLATGSSPGALFHGVVIQPLGQADHLQSVAGVHFDLLSFLLTAVAVFAVLARRYVASGKRWEPSWQLDAAFGFSGLMVLGLVLYRDFGAWLPAIALLSALAVLSDAPSTVRLAMRFLVPLAILQMLHAYPVAGSQVAWARVVVCVPCVVAVAAAADRFPGWREIGPGVRTLAVGATAVFLIAVSGFIPLTLWHNYDHHVPLDLAGTRFVRVEPHQANILHKLTKALKRDCDTFYSAPAFDSLYIYTGLPTPTGLLADAPGALSKKEQTELAGQLATLHRGEARVHRSRRPADRPVAAQFLRRRAARQVTLALHEAGLHDPPLHDLDQQ